MKKLVSNEGKLSLAKKIVIDLFLVKLLTQDEFEEIINQLQIIWGSAPPVPKSNEKSND
jgi:hypothetical protein